MRGCLLLCFIKGQFGVMKAALSHPLYDLIIKYFFTEYETEITFNAIMRERQLFGGGSECSCNWLPIAAIPFLYSYRYEGQ